MNRIYNRREDFEAEITIYTVGEGGRETAPVNGIRWDFQYLEDAEDAGAYMIWPEFVDENNETMSVPVRLGHTYHARMYIVSDDMRNHHRHRIRVGTGFYCVEGPKRVARGTVTKVTGLAP